MKIHTIGIDLGKTKFHIVGLNERGETWMGVVPREHSSGGKQKLLGKIPPLPAAALTPIKT